MFKYFCQVKEIICPAFLSIKAWNDMKMLELNKLQETGDQAGLGSISSVYKGNTIRATIAL